MDYKNKELLKFLTNEITAYTKRFNSFYYVIDPDIKLRTLDIDGNIINGDENFDTVEFLESIGYKHRPLTYGFETIQPRFTFRINIEKSADDIFNNYSSTAKKAIKKCNDNFVRTYKGTIDDIDRFIKIMKMTEKRKNFFSHQDNYYKNYLEIMMKSNMADLYFSSVNIKLLKEKLLKEKDDMEMEYNKYRDVESRKAINKIKECQKNLIAINKQLNDIADTTEDEIDLCTCISAKYCGTEWALYGGNDLNYGRFYGNYSLYHKMLMDANQDKIKTFDGFGCTHPQYSSGNADGLYKFKKNWGGELTEFIGEFDYIINKPVYFAYRKLIPLYHRIKLNMLRHSNH